MFLYYLCSKDHHQLVLEHLLLAAIHRYPVRTTLYTVGLMFTLTAVTVSPALVVPTPVVSTDLEISFDANFKN